MKNNRFITGILIGVLCLSLTGCTEEKSLYSPDDPVTLTVWTYYNGRQLEIFRKLVNEYNNTIGAKKGILVEASSQGNIPDLQQKVINGLEDTVDEYSLPNIFMGYADTAYEAYKHNKAVDLTKYLSKEELGEYVDDYIKEGDLNGDGKCYIFPIAKSTEIMVINQTDWNKFAGETKTSVKKLKTMEGIVEVARAYYEWTDAKTPDIPNDGQSFWGRDSISNYILIGAMQMGTEVFGAKEGKMNLDFDKRVIRRLWDCYYIPMVKGYFASTGKFRSDDMKIGNIISFVGSSSGITYISKEVNTEDGRNYPIELMIMPCPVFEGGDPVAVQQGAGMVVISSTEAKETACVDFLKWFTQPENNIRFSIESGYLPVKESANTVEMIKKQEGKSEQQEVLEVSVNQVKDYRLYTPPVFEHEMDARNYLENALRYKAEEDATIVKERLEEGRSWEEAVGEFLTDENFERWYNETCEGLKSYQ